MMKQRDVPTKYKMCSTCGKIKPSQCFFSIHQSKVRSPQCRRCQLGKFDNDFKPSAPFTYRVFDEFMSELDDLHAKFEGRMEEITEKFHGKKKVVEKRKEV